MPFGLPFLGSMARRAIPLTAIAAAPLILLIGTLAVLHAQSSPTISIELSPHNSVPQNTAITATVTLSNLDPTDYSSLVFRADTTKYGTPITDEHSDCLGEDTNTDITVDVDAGSEEFELRVHKSCAAHIFGHYELDLTLFKLDSMAPGGRVELATESTRFAMNRYLTIGEPTATPPAPDTRAWLDPDPTTFDIYVGEWHFFQNRANILLYLNDHLGVKGFGDEDYQLVAPGEGRPSRTVEEACGNQPGTIVHWRRAINQGLWIAACKPGNATITLRHETDAVEFLTTNYDFQALARSGNSAPQFQSGTDARTVPENTPSGVDIGAPVTATDADNDTLTYTLGGRDGSSFAIVSSSGQLQTRNALNHETKSSYVVTVSVRDNKNDDGNSDTAIDDTITVTITVENLDELGTVTVSPAQPYIGRTSTARLNDPDDAVANVAWRWEASSDGSAGWADISGAASATYTPVSADLTRYLRASVTYDDGQGTGKSGQTAATPAVREAPVATPPPPPPPPPLNRSAKFTDGSTTDRSIAENMPSGTNIGDPVAARDPEDDTLTYSLGGADAEPFDIDAATGQMLTKSPLDYEAKANYSVILSVSDGKSSSGGASNSNDVSITVTITVENLDELGMVTVSPAQPYVGRMSTARLTDPDGALVGMTWQWERSSDRSTGWADISGAASATYTPVSADLSRYLRARVAYDDGHGTGKSGQTAATPAVREPPVATPTPVPPPVATSQPVSRPRSSSSSSRRSSPSNRAPEFEDGNSTTRSISENSPAGRTIGDALEATDRDRDTLTYSLGGDDAEFFDIDSLTGEILTRDPLDYEDQAGYTVIVSVSDGKNSRDRDDDEEDAYIDVDIYVTNVDEPGAVVLSPDEPLINMAVTAQLADPDGSSDVAWAWERSSDATAWTVIDMAASASFTPSIDDVGNYLRATATYRDNLGPRKTAQSSTGLPATANTVPQFSAGDTFAITVWEHTVTSAVAVDAGKIGDPVTAADTDGDSLTYSMSSIDAPQFAIDSATGQLSLAAGVALDFEVKNLYSLTVSVTDGRDARDDVDSSIDDTIMVHIAIANADEMGFIALSPSGPSVGVAITAFLSDPDGSASGVAWLWERSSDKIVWSAITGALASIYTPITADIGQSLRVRASYSDAQGSSKTVQAVSARAVTEFASRPVFAGTIDGAIIRTVAENTVAGGAVGAPVAAEIVGGGTLTYSLGGRDASTFSIDAATGQIRTATGTVLDYEGVTYIYSVHVTATESAGGSATVGVSIQVTDVDLPRPSGDYDVNNNEAIERDEALAAMADYLKDLLSWEDARTVAGLYSGEGGGG